MPSVEPGSFLTLHYRLSGEDGRDLVNTFEDKPATLSLGSGQLSDALEARLIGLPEGARTVFELPPGEAFGGRDPQRLRWISRKLLDEWGDPDEVYQVGDVVSFPAPDGQSKFAGTLRELGRDSGGEVLLFDFNHPLAGAAVHFEVQLIGVL